MKQLTACRSLDMPARMFCRALCLYALAIVLSFSHPVAALAQTGAPAPLPQAAQQALNKGILAAKVPDYPLAIRYFEDARKIAPDAPVIYLNLGVAESKIPSRELRAMAWLGAYLAALPNAPNAAAVKEQITALEVRNQSNVSRLIKAAQDAASRDTENSFQRADHLTSVSKLWAKSGDIAAALSTADLLDKVLKDGALEEISVVQGTQGDIPGAEATANMISEPRNKTNTLTRIGTDLTDAKDVRRARLTLLAAFQASGLIEQPSTRADRQNMVARAQIAAGDIPAAHETLVSAFKNAEISLDAYYKVMTQNASGDAYLQMHDAASAKAAFLSAYNNSKLVDEPDKRSWLQSELAKSQAKAGDLANAAQTLSAAQASANLVEGERKAFTLEILASARVHVAQAQANGAVAELPVPLADAPASDVPPKPRVGVSDWLALLDSNSQACCSALNSAPFLNLAAHLQSLPASDDPRKVFDGLYDTANRVVGTQTAVVGMVNQQFGQ